MKKEIKCENPEKEYLDRIMNMILDNRRKTMFPPFYHYGKSYQLNLREEVRKFKNKNKR